VPHKRGLFGSGFGSVFGASFVPLAVFFQPHPPSTFNHVVRLLVLVCRLCKKKLWCVSSFQQRIVLPAVSEGFAQVSQTSTSKSGPAVPSTPLTNRHRDRNPPTLPKATIPKDATPKDATPKDALHREYLKVLRWGFGDLSRGQYLDRLWQEALDAVSSSTALMCRSTYQY
jgi:hypothetical protein